MNKKEQNSRALDPQRHMIAKNMSVIPGGPENNNPMNVTDNASPPIQATSIYGDFAQNYPQMGTGVVNPMMAQSSGLQQNTPLGRGQNQGPYGLQMQPDTRANTPMTDMMESSRLNMGIQEGLPTGAMGYQGMPAIPGGVPGEMSTSGGMLPVLDGMNMTPGTEKQVVNKKGKRVK